MDYVGRIFRPPSEAHSLLLQVTIGCSHNRCAYCDMYRDKQFRPKDWDTVEKDLQLAAQMAKSHGRRHRRVFLCDGDALILPTRRLLQILNGIKQYLPWIERVGTYGDTRSVGRKSVEELKELAQAGLKIVYHGMESGHDEVLELIDKGGNAEEMVSTAQKLREAGMSHSVIVLLGIGGTTLSKEHAKHTARVLNHMDPPYVGALTTTVIPNTPLFEMQEAGRFKLPTPLEMIHELRTLVADSNFSNCRFLPITPVTTFRCKAPCPATRPNWSRPWTVFWPTPTPEPCGPSTFALFKYFSPAG